MRVRILKEGKLLKVEKVQWKLFLKIFTLFKLSTDSLLTYEEKKVLYIFRIISSTKRIISFLTIISKTVSTKYKYTKCYD